MRPLALVVLLLPALSWGGPAPNKYKPGTDSPHSTDWGPDYRKKVQAIFDKLLASSGYDAEGWRKKEDRGPTELKYIDKFAAIEGSPALALSARTGPNTADHSIVIVTYGALEFCDEDQLAFILGHEIAHLANKHPEQMQDFRMKLFEKWYEKDSARLDKLGTEGIVKAFQKENEAAMQQNQIPQEREADADGLNLVQIAGYDRAKAGSSLQRAQDWLWAQGTASEDTTHDPLWARAKQLNDWHTSQKLRETGGQAVTSAGVSSSSLK